MTAYHIQNQLPILVHFVISGFNITSSLTLYIKIQYKISKKAHECILPHPT